jgi:hypothetical protein
MFIADGKARVTKVCPSVVVTYDGSTLLANMAVVPLLRAMTCVLATELEATIEGDARPDRTDQPLELPIAYSIGQLGTYTSSAHVTDVTRVTL